MSKVYFASDFHLGIDGKHTSREREKIIVKWLKEVSADADAIYLLGDMFDYWFEYNQAIPKGFVRVLGALAQIRDEGIPLHVFTGNHDMWMFGYLEKELHAEVHREPVVHTIDGKVFMIGHGDGLGPGDYGYKFIKWVFRSKLCQWLFARIHPNTGMRLMRFFSGTSRGMTEVPQFLGEEREWLIQFCNETLKKQHVDFFVFGHRHIPIDHVLKNGTSRYINCGDWLTYYSYAMWDGEKMTLANVVA